MSAMIMEVEFLAGTSVLDAVNEAKIKAIAFDLAYVEFKFNGVEMLISQNANVDKAIDEFSRRMSDQYTNKVVVV